MESSNATPEHRSEALGVTVKLLLAIALGLAIMGFIGATAWSGAYGDGELRALETSDEAKIRQLRDEEVTQLRIALGRRSPVNRRADLYLRLAEIDLEAYRSEYLLEGRLHDKKLERGEQDKFIDHAHSRPYLMAGIKACKEILSFGIPYPKLDQVYYFMGYNYGELGERAESLKYYDTLIRNYPSSSYVSEAYRELGEAAFDAGQFRKAQGYLEQAATRGNDQSLPRIYHRLAWSYYRTKQYERAVETMKQAITSAQKSGEKFLSIREEALRDMAIFMTETGRVDEAIAYFQSVGGDKQFYPRLLEKLGKQYERNVEPAKATQVYESLLRTNPDSEAAFRVLVKLVDLDLRRGRYNEALGRLKGVKVPRSGEHDTEVAAQNLRAMVRRTATEHHEEYRKKSSRPSLEIAEAYYGSYLDTFLAQDDSRNETPEIQMYLAEVKRDLGKAKEASELYRKVIESRDKRYAKEAGALWTASLAEAIRKAAPPKGAPKADEPSALENEFVDAADQLHEALSGTSEGREAALKAAEVMAGYKNTQKQAIKRIRKLIEEDPKSPQSLTAARLWVQVLADRLPAGAAAGSSDAADDLKDAFQELRANSALMQADVDGGGKLKAQMAEQESRIKIGVIAKEEQNSDFQSAAKGYEEFAAGAASRDLAEKAYGNAVATYLKAGDPVSVDRVSGAWLKRFPKSPKAVDSIRGASTQFLIQGRFDLAGNLFEKLGREGGDADALETAARIYEGNGDMLRAQQAWSSYIESYPNGSRRWPAALALGRSYDSARQDSQATQIYRLCMGSSSEYAAECGARLADLYLRNQNVEEAKKVFKQVGAMGGRKNGSPFVGYARFKLADMMEQSQQFDRLDLPEENLKKAMKQRLDFLEPLSRAYLSAVDAGGPYAVAALDRLATWAMNFADDVDNIQPPQSAEGEQIQAFHKNLTGVSAPLRRKAISTWQEGYAKALDAELLSAAVPEMLDRLSDARVANPGRAQGFRGRLRLGGIPSDGGPDGRATALQKTREQLLKDPQNGAAWVDYGNLLWGEGKPLLAKMAYERALALNPRNTAALNNRGVIAISGDSEEDWYKASEASQLFRDALKADEFYLPAKMNRAALLNYFRLFAKAKPLWTQILAKAPAAGAPGAQGFGDAQDGLAISLQGLGDATAAESAFRKGTESGLEEARFANIYHEAARSAPNGVAGAEQCYSKLDGLSGGSSAGFERAAAEHLKRTCTGWKSEK